MTDREHHRKRYVALLGRLVKALEMSEEERAPHASLFARIASECASERVKAISPWALSDKLIEPSDPLYRWYDETLGTVVETAQGIVDAMRLYTTGMSDVEVLEALGATVVEERDVETRALVDEECRESCPNIHGVPSGCPSYVDGAICRLLR